jgi:tetratricopeptide (TPR) repeat protein
LQTSFAADADQKQNELLKTELLKRIQKSPDKTILSEFLIWIQIQEKDWEGAYIQCKALDKRKKEDGARLVGLGSICTQNENYEMAAKCYSYVLTLGKQSEYYTTSSMELIKVQYLNVTKKGAYTSTDLTELEKNFNETITELGKSATTEPILLKHAHLKAFYLNKTDEAIALLEETIALPQMQPAAQAECKLELGDILLMTGDVWEASLRYSQVEKSFKHDEIGNEAKFRNAHISYYTGDFKWAQAQLDVLKGATAKLIANDAMELSLRISDALAIDTNEAPLMIFARADLLAFQNKDDLALVTLDSINKLYPHHALADDILYKKAEIVLKHAKYTEAAAFYDTIVKQYGEDVLADDALYHLADLTENQFKNPDKAKEMYQQLLEKYPASLYVVESRKRFRRLRGDSIN